MKIYYKSFLIYLRKDKNLKIIFKVDIKWSNNIKGLKNLSKFLNKKIDWEKKNYIDLIQN